MVLSCSKNSPEKELSWASLVNLYSACQNATWNSLPEFCMCYFLAVSSCFDFSDVSFLVLTLA